MEDAFLDYQPPSTRLLFGKYEFDELVMQLIYNFYILQYYMLVVDRNACIATKPIQCHVGCWFAAVSCWPNTVVRLVIFRYVIKSFQSNSKNLYLMIK